jgi:O-Antigen ligase
MFSPGADRPESSVRSIRAAPVGPTADQAASGTAGAGQAGAGPRPPRRRRVTGWAALALLAAVAAGVLGQGAYYASVQWPVALLVAAATVLALAAWPPSRRDARVVPVVPMVVLAAWAVLDGALHGVAAAGIRPALLVLGAGCVLLVCHRLDRDDRETLLLGVVGVGVVVALTGWLGVAGRVGAWGLEGQGVWRASSTLTYPNAAAAVLVPVALLVLARLVEAPRSMPLVLVAAGLLAGLAATMSRAGAVALAAGLAVLAGVRGPRATARAAVGPGAGAALALASLVPSMPAGSPPRPGLALAGLAAGLGVAATVARLRRWAAVVAVLGGGTLAGLALIVAGGGGAGGAGWALRTVAAARVSLASPDRDGALRAALQVIAEHPVTGVGPGQAELRWLGPDGVTRFFVYAHNEYAQAAAELGLVGLALLAVLLAAIARSLWRARATCPTRAAWAGAVSAAAAFALHSAFDFVWHLPAVVLTVLLLVGVALPAPAAPMPGPSQLTGPSQPKGGVREYQRTKK